MERKMLIEKTAQTSNTLWNLAMAYQQSSILFAGLEVGLFDVIPDEGISREDCARQLKLETTSADLLLQGLVELGILKQNKSHYQILEAFRPFLYRNSDFCEKLLSHKEQNLLWLRLLAVLHDPNQQETFEDKMLSDDGETSTYLRSVKAFNENSAQNFINFLSPYWKHIANVMDLGGGHGLYSHLLLSKLDKVNVSIVDLEKSIAFCKKEQSQSPFLNRIQFVVGDALKLNYQNAFDAIMLSDLLHAFSDNDKVAILRNCFNALKPGGYIAISKFKHIQEQLNQHVFFSIKLFLRTRGGYLETDEDVVKWLKDLGMTITAVNRDDPSKTFILGKKSG
jgi:SAM-dependent methyltransferase